MVHGDVVSEAGMLGRRDRAKELELGKTAISRQHPHPSTAGTAQRMWADPEVRGGVGCESGVRCTVSLA